MNRTLKLFTISLILNVLMVGIMIGQAGRFMVAPPPPPMPPKVEALSGAKRQLFETTMDAVHKEGDETRKKVREAREEALRILKAEHFDKDAYMAQVEKIHALYGSMSQHMAEAVTSLAGKFNQDERKILADALRTPPPPGGPGGPGAMMPPSSGNMPPPPPPTDAPPQ